MQDRFAPDLGDRSFAERCPRSLAAPSRPTGLEASMAEITVSVTYGGRT